MKYIEKRNEPASLKTYRETTPDATWEGFIDSEHQLKEALLEEQGHICAYCMRRISIKRNKALQKPSIEVGHFIPRAVDPSQSLIYHNMLGVCNGNFGENEHCDKSQKNECLQILNPLSRECEQRLTYTSDGRIKALSINADVDINLLNLNDQNLVNARKGVIDIALTEMVDKYPKRQWTKTLIQQEIELWKARDSKGKFKPFCQIAIWFWEKQKQSNRYPTR